MISFSALFMVVLVFILNSLFVAQSPSSSNVTSIISKAAAARGVFDFANESSLF